MTVEQIAELCHDTGYYGDKQPGIKGNREYQPCECNAMYRCRRVLARREIAAANDERSGPKGTLTRLVGNSGGGHD